jgi:serine/arginine repetitive matrix protein 1
MAALWNLPVEVQISPAGIPQSFVEEKKVEMHRAEEGDTRALRQRDRRQRLDEIRERERSERSERGGGRRNWKRWSTERQWLERPWRREQSFPRFQSQENISRSLASTISLSSSSPPRGRTPSSDRSSRSGDTSHRSRSRSPIRARSRCPPLHRGSPSLSNSSSSPPRRRRRRSPSFSPREHERDHRSRRRDNRSLPPCRRRIIPPPPPRGRTPSRSPDHGRRRRSLSPRRTRKDRSLSSERSPPPRRKRGEPDRRQNRSRSKSRSRGAENGRGATKRLSSRSSRSRTRRHDEGKGRGCDLSPPNGPPSGIRIKGQAKVERQRNKMDTSDVRLSFPACFIPGELMRAATGRRC